MAHLYQELIPQTVYVDKKSGYSADKWTKAIKLSRTLYVGNLSFFTSEEQIHELFSKCGEVKRIIMGLDRYKKSPCGFCFVEYFTHEQAEQAVNLLNKTMFDDRLIRVDWDAGFSEGRQYGRGESGGQWRDDFRADVDEARGGAGRNLLKQIEGMPGRQIYVGELKHGHGRFGRDGQDGEPAAKRRRYEEGAGPWGGAATGGPGFPGFDGFGHGLPMAFGPMGQLPFGFYGKGKGKGKGGGKGKGKAR